MININTIGVRFILNETKDILTDNEFNIYWSMEEQSHSMANVSLININDEWRLPTIEELQSIDPLANFLQLSNAGYWVYDIEEDTPIVYNFRTKHIKRDNFQNHLLRLVKDF